MRIVPDIRLPGKRRNRIGIVGSGIIGSSIAYHMSRRGAEVILFEKTRPAAGATENSFAWINATFVKQPYHYHRLNRLGSEGWLHLDREMSGTLNLQWTGGVVWCDDPEKARELERQVECHQAWGYPTHIIQREELMSLEEHIVPGPILAAAYCEYEGSVDPVHATQILVTQARENGARFECPCTVLGLDIRSGRLHGVKTTLGDVEVDTLVVAAGVDTPRLGAMAGLQVPMKNSRGLLAHTIPTSPLVKHVVHAPGAIINQGQDGRIVTGIGFEDIPSTDTSPEQGERILDQAARFLPAIKETELERVTLGWRPTPLDGHPIVGFHDQAPDIYLAVMHSGVTLAPIIGQLTTLEILDNVRVELLQDYCLSRFEKGASPTH